MSNKDCIYFIPIDLIKKEKILDSRKSKYIDSKESSFITLSINNGKFKKEDIKKS